MSRLMKAGIDAKVAARAAQGLELYESSPKSRPNGRELMRQLSGELPCDSDEFIFFDPDLDSLPTDLLLENPRSYRFRMTRTVDQELVAVSEHESDRMRKMLSRHRDRAFIIINLSAIRRTVLRRLEELENGA